MKRKILFITPYPYNSAGSQRFRFEQFLHELPKYDIEYRQIPFLDQATWKIFYKEGKFLQKIWGLIKGITRRLYCLIIAKSYDLIFIHREAAPIGPPIIEFVLSKMLRKRIIFDFDDAIWIHDTSTSNMFLRKLKSSEDKTAKIITFAHKIYAGNQYLADYALQFNQNVILSPTIVNTDYHKKTQVKHSEKICIGWTGTHTTIKHFEAFIPVLEILYKKHSEQIYFKLIANKFVAYKELDLHSTIWKREQEIEQLSEFDIGIMPLPDDKWSKGKCGFKAIQYMALEIPPIVSPVGMNAELVDNGISGFVCDTQEEWLAAFEILITDAEKRKQIGTKARHKIINHFSTASIKENFISNLC